MKGCSGREEKEANIFKKSRIPSTVHYHLKCGPYNPSVWHDWAAGQISSRLSLSVWGEVYWVLLLLSAVIYIYSTSVDKYGMLAS